MACLWLAFVPPLSAQIVVTNICVADVFVRSLDPSHNYGGAGALSISGPLAMNAIGQQEGLLDSFMRFDAATAVSNFNGSLGPGQWAIVRATLNLFEQGAPNNAIFNRGVGPFEVRWITNDSWAEGTGNPNAPTTDGTVWNDEPSILNSNADESLGTFINGGTDGVVRLTLAMASGFASDVSTGGLVSFYVTATTNSLVGFTFHSHNFVDSNEWPFVEIAAAPIPRITSLTIVGSEVRIAFTTGTNLSYVVEYNTNLVSASWNALTNMTGSGNSMTAIDPGATAMSRRFYRVRLVAPP